VSAAARLFAEHGLEGASIDQIAQAAGYTKGAFYANFASKEELFLVMLDERFAEELERLDRELRANEDPLAGAQAAARDFVAFAGTPEWSRLYFQFAAHAARNEEFRQGLARHHQAMRRRLTEIFAGRREALGIDPPVATEDVAAMICAMADGFLVDRMIDPDLKPELYAQMVGVFLAGLIQLAGVRA